VYVKKDQDDKGNEEEDRNYEDEVELWPKRFHTCQANSSIWIMGEFYHGSDRNG